MVEPVLLIERVVTSIALGESHFREFKSALHGLPGAKELRAKRTIKEDICETLVAFANADGGELLVGVEDNGEITGFQSANQELFSELLNCYKDGVYKKTPLSSVRAVQLNIEYKDILYFSTPKSMTTIHHTSNGRCVLRRDLENIPISADEIVFTRQEQISREYDRQFVGGAHTSDLDLDLVKALAEQISVGTTAEKCLQILDLADFSDGYLKLRRAALLLFSKEPMKWHPRLPIRILRVSGTEVKAGENYNISEEFIEGNILELIERTWQMLRPHLVQTRLTGSARFETRIMYPELACREALINAIAHRDYSAEGRGIEIYVFDDRMEVRSPGSLLSSLTVDDLKRLEGAHQSRNSLVARVLREMGYVREIGEGIRRIFELMESNELAEPDISSTSQAFIVTLSNKPVYKAEHLLWLENFSRFTLTREQKAIVVLGYGGRLISANDIWNTLGLQDTEEYRKLIASLQVLEILRTEINKRQANKIRHLRKVNSRDIPRFRIQVPSETPPRILSIAPESGQVIREDRSPGLPATRLQRAHPRYRGRPDQFDAEARVYIGNLSMETQPSALFEFFMERDMDADVEMPQAFGRGKGYAFAQFKRPVDAKKAIQTCDGEEFQGRRLVLRPALRRSLATF
jgi:ATP-dependent DNA helicase RecG